MTAISDVRPSPIAGRWYEGDPKRLAAKIDTFISNAKLPLLEGDVVGVIAPHAGHIYSGETAGYAFAAVKGRSFPLVAIFSPLHNFHPSPLLTTAHSAYRTPLGDMKVDVEVLARLDKGLAEHGISLSRIAYDQEHSLEIELPFLQRALAGEFQLLPVMVRSEDPDFLRTLGECAADALEGRIVLLVASTDLSHFHAEEHADVLDEEMLGQIGDFSPDGVLFAERSGSGSACGSGAVAAVMWAAKKMGASNVLVLHHSTSGKTTGDHDSVVGYGAAVILKESIDPNP
jgi:MEMO1 family protein